MERELTEIMNANIYYVTVQIFVIKRKGII